MWCGVRGMLKGMPSQRGFPFYRCFGSVWFRKANPVTQSSICGAEGGDNTCPSGEQQVPSANTTEKICERDLRVFHLRQCHKLLVGFAFTLVVQRCNLYVNNNIDLLHESPLPGRMTSPSRWTKRRPDTNHLIVETGNWSWRSVSCLQPEHKPQTKSLPASQSAVMVKTNLCTNIVGVANSTTTCYTFSKFWGRSLNVEAGRNFLVSGKKGQGSWTENLGGQINIIIWHHVCYHK